METVQNVAFKKKHGYKTKKNDTYVSLYIEIRFFPFKLYNIRINQTGYQPFKKPFH